MPWELGWQERHSDSLKYLSTWDVHLEVHIEWPRQKQETGTGNTERDRDMASQGHRPRAITRQTERRTGTASNAERCTLACEHTETGTQENRNQAQVSGRLISMQTGQSFKEPRAPPECTVGRTSSGWRHKRRVLGSWFSKSTLEKGLGSFPEGDKEISF